MESWVKIQSWAKITQFCPSFQYYVGNGDPLNDFFYIRHSYSFKNFSFRNLRAFEFFIITNEIVF